MKSNNTQDSATTAKANSQSQGFNSIAEAIAAYKKGEMIVLLDDEHRENEGDICCAAQYCTPEKINFMTKMARGLICLAITPQQAQRLNLPLMVKENTSAHHTNFTISIEAAKGVSTGISVYDRAITIKAAINPQAQPADVVRPGHMFPLIAKPGGVLQRAGQTEGSVDLAKLANLNPAAVICEILDDDGTAARQNWLMKFATKHGLKIINIKDLIAYRLQKESYIKIAAKAQLPTKFGEFEIVALNNTLNNEEYVAITMGSWTKEDVVLTRVHSQCLTGDVFSSLRCDCQSQLHKAMQIIAAEGRGVILYLPQEGRGIGITNKIHAYRLQEEGKDTVEANEALGFSADLRDYGFGAQALLALGLKKICLLTNNPRKIIALEGFDLQVVKRQGINLEIYPENKKYLQTKKNKLGHLIDF